MTHPALQGSPDHQVEDPSDNLGVENLGVYIADLFNALDKTMTQEAASYDITGMEYSLLWYCLERERTATQLARVLPVDGSRISRIVTTLVDKGLLRRRRLRSDRRIVMLRLTEEGLERTSRIFQKMQRYYATLAEGISAEEMRVFASVTSRIVANYAAMQEAE